MEVDQVDSDEIDGSIYSIHVKNFFCHDNLEITFNPNVNFIIGRNGSGKSAILTALVVGLGGRASATNRGSNLHSFIKKGANSASVAIKIKNNTQKAFRHDLYGDYITVVRNITASGSSSYKIKNANGEVVSTKFAEVNAIVLALDIQVDNPISVLNQDDARSFHAADAKKKYALFRKATNLDITEINYQKALENCAKAKAIWQRKNEACQELEKEYKQWQARFEQLQSRVEVEEYRQQLQDEYYWSEIVEYEKEEQTLQAQYDKLKGRVSSLMTKMQGMEQDNVDNSETIAVLKENLNEKISQKKEMEQNLRNLESKWRDTQNSWKCSQHSGSNHQEQYNREKLKMSDLEREIENSKNGSAASQRAHLTARAEKAAEVARDVHARYQTAQHDAQQARLNSQRAAQAAEELANALQRQQNTIHQLKAQLREYQSRGGDSLALYGQNMSELCRQIRDVSAKGGFSAPPKGPIGSFLKVKEKKWAGALEHIIGGSIESFCVNTAADSRALFGLMGEVYGSRPKPAVICSQFLKNRHDVSRNKVRAGSYISALDSLDVADPVIANFLIDNIGVESILLVPEHEDAIRLSDNVENVPVNCNKIVTLDSTEFHPAPNYRSYGGSNRASRYLQVSCADRIRQVQAEIKEAEAKCSVLEEQLSEATNEAQSAKRVEKEASRVLQALLTERHEKDRTARVAAVTLEQLQEPQHKMLVEELEASKEILESIEKQISELSEKEQEYKKKQDEFNYQISIIKRELNQVNTDCRSLNEEIEVKQLKLERSTSEYESCSRRVKEETERLSRANTMLLDKRNTIQNKTKMASELCDRVQDPREKPVIIEELKATDMRLNLLRSDGLSKEEVTEALLAVQTTYTTTKRRLDDLHGLCNKVRKAADTHLNFCCQVQSSIARRVQYSFQSILTLRGYSGRMDIDAARGSLELWCGGRGGGGARAGGTSALSGGERSYATVAFIMALWDCAELPFCFMDEFDVFMDNVNRKIVLDLLVSHALQHRTRQYVFLTPQDTAALTASDHIKIHRMADPRRR